MLTNDVKSVDIFFKKTYSGSSPLRDSWDRIKEYFDKVESASSNTTQAEIAAIVERHDNAVKMGYLDNGLESKLWEELRQLSAVR